MPYCISDNHLLYALPFIWFILFIAHPLARPTNRWVCRPLGHRDRSSESELRPPVKENVKEKIRKKIKFLKHALSRLVNGRAQHLRVRRSMRIHPFRNQRRTMSGLTLHER